VQQCLSEILPDGARASCFGLMGASHFEKAVRGGFRPHRLSAPGGVAKSDFNYLRTVVPVGFSAHPFVRGPAGHKSFSGRWEPRELLVRAEVPRTSADSEITYGEDWFCGAWVARNGGPFSRSRQAACPQIFARRRGPGTRAPQAFVLIAGLRARKAAAVLWARCTGIFPCARK